MLRIVLLGDVLHFCLVWIVTPFIRMNEYPWEPKNFIFFPNIFTRRLQDFLVLEVIKNLPFFNENLGLWISLSIHSTVLNKLQIWSKSIKKGRSLDTTKLTSCSDRTSSLEVGNCVTIGTDLLISQNYRIIPTIQCYI